MPPFPCIIDGVKLLCLRMENINVRNKNVLRHADWVSRIKIERGEVTHSTHTYDTRLFVQHLEVFKKPPECEELPTVMYGLSRMSLNLEDGKEYLICGELIFTNATYCSVGQIKPHGAEPGSNVAMEWHQFSPEYIDEMKAFLELVPEEFLYTY